MADFIPVYEPVLGGNEKKYVLDCLDTGWISSLGKYVTDFENKFSAFSGKKFGVSVANGTVALQLALIALDIKKGDEVIIPDLTFVATANAVSYTGAKPVFVDSERETWNMDPSRIEEKITSKTRAIMPVHLFGHPCDMDPIMDIAKDHDLFVIEDAAEAHGAEYKGKKAGSFGHVSCFSFYGNKTITTGEGGMCITSDGDLAKEMSFLKDHGMSSEKRYYHTKIGFNLRLTNIQAAIGLAQLEQIEKFIDIKRKNALFYNSLLKDIEGVSLPPEMPWAKNTYWMYSILLRDREARDRMMSVLKEEKIDSRPFFFPMHQLPMYKLEKPFPVSDDLSARGMNLPSAPSLSKEDVERICGVIKNSQV
ncbi:DegT/DnrJ/EryC1/StrS family aminotransferase [Candidatus Woesearchaeota archaeon]|nr:DegT/DnrJ/EryC1/StrS family aminotransferase [Candidatus Woesearchaeota archaeon]